GKGTSNRGAGKPPRRRPALTTRLARVPAWAASLGVHTALVLLLSLWTLATLDSTPPVLTAGTFDGEDDFFDALADIDLAAMPDELDLDSLELSPVAVEDFSTAIDESLLAPQDAAAEGYDATDPGLAAAVPMATAATLVGESGGRPDAAGTTGDAPAAPGRPGATRFFGAKSRGDRFVFLIDNSGTMKEGRLETTMLELQRAVGAMNAKQHFYVVFYSDQAYPMFFPDSVAEMQPATRQNKRRLGDWLGTVEMCVGGRVQDAMEMAIGLDPHVVYLLSDGDIRSQRTMDFLTSDSGWPFVVHTLGMTVRDAKHAQRLVAIARAHRGAFTPVGVSPAAAEIARRRPIAYHNLGPGPVWGSKVRPR
ncbi:MAG: hypothetical protein AAF790_04355, partial [Planctomycetota bacterium]